MPQAVRRTFNPRKDLEQACDLAEVAYAEDYARIGREAEGGVGSEDRASGVVGVMAGILPSLRDLNQGFVWEEDGRIVALVLYARTGLGGSQWSIEAVATHPDRQRRGLAKCLLQATLDELRSRGGTVCTLKVREDNEGANALYRDLGFVHYDTSIHLRSDAMKSGGSFDVPPPASPPSLRAYRFVDAPPRTWFSTWQERGDLACRSQSEEARAVCPVVPAQFRRPWFAPALAPMLTKLSGHTVRHRLVRLGEQVVATLAADLALRGPDPHEVTIDVDPDHEESLSAVLVPRALALLAGAPPAPILTEARSNQACLLGALERRGFARVITWHQLGLRL